MSSAFLRQMTDGKRAAVTRRRYGKDSAGSIDDSSFTTPPPDIERFLILPLAQLSLVTHISTARRRIRGCITSQLVNPEISRDRAWRGPKMGLIKAIRRHTVSRQRQIKRL